MKHFVLPDCQVRDGDDFEFLRKIGEYIVEKKPEKIICLGDIKQIDTPYLSETTSGLTFAVDRFKNWEHSAHMSLTRGERSRLAFYAAEHL